MLKVSVVHSIGLALVAAIDILDFMDQGFLRDSSANELLFALLFLFARVEGLYGSLTPSPLIEQS